MYKLTKWLASRNLFLETRSSTFTKYQVFAFLPNAILFQIIFFAAGIKNSRNVWRRSRGSYTSFYYCTNKRGSYQDFEVFICFTL